MVGWELPCYTAQAQEGNGFAEFSFFAVLSGDVVCRTPWLSRECCSNGAHCSTFSTKLH
jgi:hypothetical protein